MDFLNQNDVIITLGALSITTVNNSVLNIAEYKFL